MVCMLAAVESTVATGGKVPPCAKGLPIFDSAAALQHTQRSELESLAPLRAFTVYYSPR